MGPTSLLRCMSLPACRHFLSLANNQAPSPLHRLARRYLHTRQRHHSRRISSNSSTSDKVLARLHALSYHLIMSASRSSLSSNHLPTGTPWLLLPYPSLLPMRSSLQAVAHHQCPAHHSRPAVTAGNNRE